MSRVDAGSRRPGDVAVTQCTPPGGEARRGELPPVAKPAAVRCLGPVDVGPLAAQIARVSDRAWRIEDSVKENDFPCFRHTQHIIFRFIAGNRDPRRFYSKPAWRVWRRWLLPVMTRAAAPYRFADPVFPKAMLARLEAGHRIDTHIDAGRSDPRVHKVHVPIMTDPRALLTVGGTGFHLAAGHAWEVNNLARHGAFNGGAQDRVHFIFEVFDDAGADLRGGGFTGA